MFGISIEDRGFTQNLEGIVSRANRIPPGVFESVGQVLIRSVSQNFLQEGRPSQWQPSRAAIQEGRRTLWKSGKLANSPEITNLTDSSVEVSTGKGLNYAPYVNFGTRNQVISTQQRKFFWFKFMQTKDDFWKAMALSKTLKGLPARRFNLFQDQDTKEIGGVLGQFIFFNSRNFGISLS